jgi:hypothetical protein
MASSSDHDKDTNDSQSKTDNPFIKFRQFADSQIGSLLQGIIGLPSAFTKQNNARWAEFDEDMRRRDELQKKQNGLRESEARRAEQSKEVLEGYQDGLRTLGAESSRREESARGGWPSWEDLSSSSKTIVDDEEMDEKTARDIPLYSPVSKSLFAHLRDAEDDKGTDWKPVPENWEHLDSFTEDYVDPSTQPRQWNAMKALRSNVYSDLKLNPILRSQYSLLPYLLFSPYSPIRLDEEGDDGCGLAISHMDAFEDLILTTQGRSPSRCRNWHDVFGPTVEYPRAWIYHLWAHGALQERSTTDSPFASQLPRMLCGRFPLMVWPQLPLMSRDIPSAEDARTELEMYERFLQRASSYAGIPDVLDSLFSDAEGWFNKQLSSLDPTELKRAMKEFTDFLERKTGNEAEDENRAEGAKDLESLFAQATALLESRRKNETSERRHTHESFSETKVGKELEDIKRKVAADPDKAVFMSTTTEHTTNEDGSVETTVTVWKRFADGRETTTTTSHTEGPASEYGNQNERSTPIEKVQEEKKDDKTMGKKGWFWN